MLGLPAHVLEFLVMCVLRCVCEDSTDSGVRRRKAITETKQQEAEQSGDSTGCEKVCGLNLKGVSVYAALAFTPGPCS